MSRSMCPLVLGLAFALGVAGPACAQSPAAKATEASPPDAAALHRAAQAWLEKAKEQGFSGAVLVADGRNVLFEGQAGLADPASGAIVGPDTRFNLASTGKLFTTIAVLQLHERGKLDLDAPIGRYLPEWPVRSVREQVTARQLLTHTSGLGAFWGEDFKARRQSLHQLRDYVPLLAVEPAFKPGTAFNYSNSGFMLLGLLVEAVSGQSYYDYVAQHVFAPAGMRDTGYYAIDGRAEHAAVPHRGGTGADRDAPILPLPEPRGAAAGGGYSTARDLLRFHRALLDGRLLGASESALLFAPVELPPGTRAPPHGLGVLRYAAGGDVAYGHPGGAPGIGVDFRGLRDSGFAVVVMSNSEQPRTMSLVPDLLAALSTAGGPDLRLPRRGPPTPAPAR